MKMIHVEMSDVHVLVSRAHTNCQHAADIDAKAFRYIDNHVDNCNGRVRSDFCMLCKYESLIKFPILYGLLGDYEASFLLFFSRKRDLIQDTLLKLPLSIG